MELDFIYENIAESESHIMGRFLNSPVPYVLYKRVTLNPYFVDKSKLLEELFPLIDLGNQYLCITRPRRFGKTVMANMIGSFFTANTDSSVVFDRLRIASSREYHTHLNNHNVIYNRLSES